MNGFRIPFNKPSVTGNEFRYLADAVAKGHISGGGGYAQKCQRLLEEHLQVKKSLLTTSGTHALEMAAMLLDLQPGDEIILPSFTFVSTANAFVLRGARPVFVDIRRDSLNLDETQVEAHVTPQTKAIVAVHYGGVGCEMDAIIKIAASHSLEVIEDNAHGLFGTYKGRPLGTLGSLAALSFHETKNISCGEGGALLINNPAYVERAEVIREKGTDRSRFFQGAVDKYTWMDIGSSYMPSDLLAAFLLAQLEAREVIQSRRQRIWEFYAAHLEAWAHEQRVRLPMVPPHCGQSYHLFYLLLPSLKQRQALIAHLKDEGILSVFHYQPLHLSKMGRRFGGRLGQCPVTEDVSDRLLRLPFYNDLTERDQTVIVDAIKRFSCH